MCFFKETKMKDTVIDFTKGIKSVSIEKYRSKSTVNSDYDCARITINLDIKQNRALFNALRYDNEGNDNTGS